MRQSVLSSSLHMFTYTLQVYSSSSNIVQTNMKVVFRTGASVWWVCPCTMSAVSEERC